MKVVTLYFLVIYAIVVVRSEDAAEVLTTTDFASTQLPTNENVTDIPTNATTEDKPLALALQRIRRDPPLTIYKHRLRVSRRKPRPRRRNKGHRPVYGPPKHRPPPPISHYKPPPHFESDESPNSYSYSPPRHKPRDSFSHGALDVSSDFNIQSIPAADYGESKESYEAGVGDPYDDEVIPFEKLFNSYAKPVEKKKKKKKHHRVKSSPQAYDTPFHHSQDNLRVSYDPPVKSIEYDTHTFSEEAPSYPFGPKTHTHGKRQKPSSYNRITPPKYLNKEYGSFDSPLESHDSIGSISPYEPPKKHHKVRQEIPDYSHLFTSDLQDDDDSIYKHKSSINTHDDYQQGTGYSYDPPGKAHGKGEQQDGYHYTPSKLPYKPHETYGVPPKPPSSSYGYPVLSGHSPPSENVHSLPDIPLKSKTPHFSYNPSPPGSLFDLPSQSSSGEVFGKPSGTDYFPPDSSYSFTTNTNAYNSLPTEGTKHLPGNFAEPPGNYKPDFSKSGLSTSHFPLDQDHLSSNYGSPKSSYEVPIYDAVPFTTPPQEHYPPSLPTSYDQGSFENIARGSNRVQLTTSQRNRNTKLTLNRQKVKINAQPTPSGSSEDSSESTLDYLERVLRKKRKNKRKPNRDANRFVHETADQDGAYSSQPEVRLLPTRSTSNPTISTVLNNTSSFSSWIPMAPTRQTSQGHSYQVASIDKSHSTNYYGGLMSSDVHFSNQKHHERENKKQFNPREDTSEVNLQSSNIYVSDKKTPSPEVTRKGSIFDESLNYWKRNPLPPNHKLH